MIIYNALNFAGVPEDFGAPCSVLYGKDHSEQEIRDAARAAARRGALFVLDAEYKPQADDLHSRSLVAAKYEREVKIAREAEPGLAIGVYEWPDCPNHLGLAEWTANSVFGAVMCNLFAFRWKYTWTGDNIGQRLATRETHGSLYSLVDVLCPTLYLSGATQADWLKMATADIELIRALCPDKPLLPFLMMYKDQAALEPLDADDVRQRMELCAEKADGFVLWDGHTTPWSQVKGHAWVKEAERWL